MVTEFITENQVVDSEKVPDFVIDSSVLHRFKAKIALIGQIPASNCNVFRKPQNPLELDNFLTVKIYLHGIFYFINIRQRIDTKIYIF